MTLTRQVELGLMVLLEHDRLVQMREDFNGLECSINNQLLDFDKWDSRYKELLFEFLEDYVIDSTEKSD